MKGVRNLTLGLLLVAASCQDGQKEQVVPAPKSMPIPMPIPVSKPQPVLCEQNVCWDTSVYVCRDEKYNALFTRSSGWTGGDATYSVDLKNGKTLWMFGDTFIDQVNQDRSRPSFKLINNSLVLQNGSEMTTYHSGTSVNPAAFAKPPEDGDWYWPGDGTVANGKLYLFMHGFGTGGGGAWDFFRTSIDLLTINPETMVIENSSRLFGDPTISWGAAIMEDTDYTYVYGVLSDDSGKDLYVARTNEDLTTPWEYFTGTAWNSDPNTAGAIFSGVSEEFSVFKDGAVYYLLTQDNFFGKKIYLYNSTTPEGAFGAGRTVYCTPETGGNIYTYNAFAHTQIYQDSLLVSYNVNSFDYTDILHNADNYRPYFVRIGGWRKK